MNVAELVKLANAFTLNRAAKNVKVDFAVEPWCPGTQYKSKFAYWSERGVYVYSALGKVVPAGESLAEVWYVGKANDNSTSSMARRVFAHLGNTLDSAKERLPRFVNHDWMQAEIDDQLKNAIADGKFHVFMAAVSGDGPSLPEELEAFLLQSISKREGKIPLLNRTLPREKAP